MPELSNSELQLQISTFKSQTSMVKFQISSSKLQIPNFTLQASRSTCQLPAFKFHLSDSKFHIPKPMSQHSQPNFQIPIYNFLLAWQCQKTDTNKHNKINTPLFRQPRALSQNRDDTHQYAMDGELVWVNMMVVEVPHWPMGPWSHWPMARAHGPTGLSVGSWAHTGQGSRKHDRAGAAQYYK